MPQETRPRTVSNTVNITDTMPQQSSFIPDPSLMPASGDPYQEVFALLQNLQSQSYQPPKESNLQIILNALAQGAGIAASNDPGAALTNILGNRLQVQQNRENAERTRQAQIQSAMIQTMLDKARGISTQQAEAKKEGRAFAYKGAEAQLEVATQQQLDLNRSDIKMQEMQKTEDFLNRTSGARKQRLIQENPELYNKSIDFASVMQQFIPTMPAYVARGIADKIYGQSNQPFTKEESIFYNRYNQSKSEDWKQDKELKRRVAESQISENEAQAEYYRKIAELGGNKTDPFLSQMYDEAVRKATATFVRTKSGLVVPVDDIKKLNISDQFGYQVLSPEEQATERQKYIDKLANLKEKIAESKITNAPQPGNVTVNPTTDWMQTISRARINRMSWDAIIAEVNKSTKLTAEEKQAALDYINKQKKGGQMER